jgi:hypothetical protein
VGIYIGRRKVNALGISLVAGKKSFSVSLDAIDFPIAIPFFLHPIDAMGGGMAL